MKIGARVHEIPQMVDAKVTVDESGKMHFPALILYEESMQCDIIKDFREDMTLAFQLAAVIDAGLPWDTAKAYKLDNIEIYFETNITKPLDPSIKTVKTKARVKKCDLNAKLIDVLKDELYVIPQFPVFIVVAKGTPFYSNFLANSL